VRTRTWRLSCGGLSFKVPGVNLFTEEARNLLHNPFMFGGSLLARCIIFNGSVHKYLGQPGVAAYAATKGGLVSMARAIAADLASRNIRVNVVAPGATKTPIWERGSRASISEEQSAKLADFVSWGSRKNSPKRCFASDDSSYVNAGELMVDREATGAPWAAPLLRG
jgi:NAD(P)-dependent dehydrogenase (short-subunit alcohol dehydrogenase family)